DVRDRNLGIGDGRPRSVLHHTVDGSRDILCGETGREAGAQQAPKNEFTHIFPLNGFYSNAIQAGSGDHRDTGRRRPRDCTVIFPAGQVLPFEVVRRETQASSGCVTDVRLPIAAYLRGRKSENKYGYALRTRFSRRQSNTRARKTAQARG